MIYILISLKYLKLIRFSSGKTRIKNIKNTEIKIIPNTFISFFPQECCYSVFGFFSLGPLIRRIPDAGSTLSANPFFQPVDYYIENQRPKEVCCASGHCDWYYTYRPRPFFCSRFIPVRTGQFI